MEAPGWLRKDCFGAISSTWGSRDFAFQISDLGSVASHRR
jgi:hypothetical protein